MPLTKSKLLEELQNLTDIYGYWSKEVKEFNSKLPFEVMCEINNKVIR